jgi:hypothetical protein
MSHQGPLGFWRVQGGALAFTEQSIFLSVGIRRAGYAAGLPAKASIAVAAVVHNPAPMLGWGLIVAVALAVGSLPFLFGLAVVLPVLGHATWHLYRRTVESG